MIKSPPLHHDLYEYEFRESLEVAPPQQSNSMQVCIAAVVPPYDILRNRKDIKPWLRDIKVKTCQMAPRDRIPSTIASRRPYSSRSSIDSSSTTSANSSSYLLHNHSTTAASRIPAKKPTWFRNLLILFRSKKSSEVARGDVWIHPRLKYSEPSVPVYAEMLATWSWVAG
jgi:hypothetical protein